MATFCLIPQKVDEFKKALRAGKIDPFKMADMSSVDRRKYLSQFVGEENAKQVNALYESKLLLKNQKAGYISWAKKVAGISPEVRRDLIAKIERLDKVLDPKEGQLFLEDLAATKLGVSVTQEEAKTVFTLSEELKKVSEKWNTTLKENPNINWRNNPERLAVGRAKVKLYNYVNNVKAEATKSSIADYVKNPIKTTKELAGQTKSLTASLDNSAIFRQGWKTLMTHPMIWQRNARSTFSTIVKTWGGKPVIDELNADILSRPTYDLMVKSKLAIGTVEEAFPGSVVEKLPIAGRLYKSSENAFTLFLHKQRADIFDKYIEIAKKSGVNINDRKELEAIGSMVNSLTGRGNFGKYEGAAVDFANNVFFSPRYLKSQVDTLGHVITGAGGSNFVRKQAAINLLRIVMGTAAVLAIADAMKPGSVEKDPRSADFGKIKIGTTRFDVTGGLSSIVVLASRVISKSSKSSTTDKVSELNSGEFGAKTVKDTIYDFFENKFSPPLAVLRDLTEGSDRSGNKPTIAGELENLFTPMSYRNYKELQKDPNSADTLLAMIADGLGIATNTYGIREKNWSQKPTKMQEAFLKSVGQKTFEKANEDYNKAYQVWFTSVTENTDYQKLSEPAKERVIENSKAAIQEKIFKKYGFVYKEKKQSNKQEDKIVKRLSTY